MISILPSGFRDTLATHIRSNRESCDAGIELYKRFKLRKTKLDHLTIDGSHIVVIQRPIYDQVDNLLSAAQDLVDLPVTWIDYVSRNVTLESTGTEGITSELFP